MLSADMCSHPLPRERRELLTVAAAPWPITVVSQIGGHHFGAIASCASCGSASGWDSYSLTVELEAREAGSNENRLFGEPATSLARDDDPGGRATVDAHERSITIEHCLSTDGRRWAARATGGVEGQWRIVHLFEQVGAVVIAQDASPADPCSLVLERAPEPRAWLEQRLDAGDPFGLACRLVRADSSLDELLPRCERVP